jgi:beta-glucanase (GH16 family)
MCILFAVAATPGYGQTLVWSEEFDGPDIDLSTWTYDVGGGGFGNQELQYHTARPENARIENGKLVIEARREPYNGKQFTSARLKTHGRLAFQYGTIEARIKVPNLANGLWPAFWLLGNNVGETPWPGSGEIDILEMGSQTAIQQGVVNRWVQAAAHWDYNGSYAGYWQSITWPTSLITDYHIYSLSWTPQMLTAYVDGTQFWAMDITAGASASLEEFHRPFFVILNLAVGGINFVQITDPALITAPMPAPMYVDWVHLYDNGYTQLIHGADTAETGNFGVFTDTTPVTDAVAYDVDADLFAWHNVTIGTAAPYEGPSAWSFHVSPGDWFGLGVACRTDRNMQNYSDGNLHLHMKTTNTMTLGIGIASSAAGESWLNLVNGGEQFGLVRDGQWHEVVIPLNRYSNIDFATIRQLFMLRGIGPSTAFDVYVDNVYWTADVARVTPENGSFGVFTETPAHQTAGQFTLGVDGQFYVWESTLNPIAGSPYEGTSSIALMSATGLTWFGAAFTPNVKYNLTAFRYPQSKLRFALKTTSTVTFKIGMKSGNVEDIGQRWITFQNGADPYGFVRNGQWHVVEIPMSDFIGYVDLSAVSQFFELLGTDGPITNVEIDDVAFIGGGDAIHIGQLAAGDMNCDGNIDNTDVPLFVSALLDSAAFDAAHPTCLSSQADMDGNSSVNGEDIQGFISALLGG